MLLDRVRNCLRYSRSHTTTRTINYDPFAVSTRLHRTTILCWRYAVARKIWQYFKAFFSTAEPPSIQDDVESEVEAEEGSYVTLKCVARGNPTPRITWRKGDIFIDGTKPRYRIHFDGSMQIVNLYRTDSGVYICIADNGIGNPTQKEYNLQVTGILYLLVINKAC